MQFKIPQNVDIEDKIVAFLSFRQLFILIGGGAVAYVVYTASVGKVPPYAYIIPIVFILVITVLIAFFKIDNMSFIKLILLVLERIINPTQRVWRHYPGLPTHLELYEADLQTTAKAPKKDSGENPANSIKSLTSIADIVDSQEFLIKDEPSQEETT
ncbi:hypothetical protein COW46_01850 [Candidatus Gracilibacteria bacterium CG17_big_fil_post_rev_8_21_14_2_50_48_13]|nr:MAG: hypothetical protein COW46_01850 [Candidatus Gracilibacteria bacterium CG17_big_fil_post_rev_8_21_14_2_50_48_13]